MGPNMTGGSEVRQCPTATQQEAFVAAYPTSPLADRVQRFAK